MTRDDSPVSTTRQRRGDREVVSASTLIRRPADELYTFWRDPENLAQCLPMVRSIVAVGHDRTIWTIDAPAGQSYSLASEITHAVPGREIAWRSSDDADVPHIGRVTFEDLGASGTTVHLELAYGAPQRGTGSIIARALLRKPQELLRDALTSFRHFMETGRNGGGGNQRLQRIERLDRSSREPGP